MNALTLLGTKGGASQRPGNPRPSSNLLQMGDLNAVIDCGLGVSRALLDAGVDLTDVSHIFISHMHSDHILELGPLIYASWSSGRRDPVTLIGPPELKAYVDNFLAAMALDLEQRVTGLGRQNLRDLIRLVPAPLGNALDAMGVRVAAYKTTHPPMKHSYAYRFEHKGAAAVICGDTVFDPQLAAFAQGADLLVHEAMLEDRIMGIAKKLGSDPQKLFDHITQGHCRAEDAGRLAAMADVGALALTHLIPADASLPDWEEHVRRHWQGPLHVGMDGMRLAF